MRSRRSTQVFAPLLASAAVAMLSACRSTQPERCVDMNNRIVDPKFCQNLPPGSTDTVAGTPANNGGYTNNNAFIPYYYHYYYGGSGGGVGSFASGGGSTPSPGISYSFSSDGTSRGGFGSSFGGDGGGHGGGEGGGE